MTAPSPGAHGGDGARLARALGVPIESVLDLSASLNPFAADVAPLVRTYAGAAARYPDAEEATASLAGALGVDADRVVLTNGGAEAIALVAALRPEGWVDEPDFSLYRRHLTRVRRDAPIWRSNPHNPSGVLAAAGEEAAVWDEAFYPLATGRWTSGAADGGAVVVGSLTKVFACPGLRVGYVLAPDDRFAAQVRALQPRWSVNGLAVAVVPALLERVAEVPAWAARIGRQRVALAELLRAQGFEVQAADAPWVLVPGAGDLRERLACAGLLVRDCSSFGLAGTVRIAVPDDAGLDRLDAALSA